MLLFGLLLLSHEVVQDSLVLLFGLLLLVMLFGLILTDFLLRSADLCEASGLLIGHGALNESLIPVGARNFLALLGLKTNHRLIKVCQRVFIHPAGAEQVYVVYLDGLRAYSQ